MSSEYLEVTFAFWWTILWCTFFQELNLKPGVNEARYVCQELEEIIHFSVFLFDESDKFVLSDIDGTITESDIRGHISTFLGITSVHKNVVQLFDQIGQNGYKIIYLTARCDS